MKNQDLFRWEFNEENGSYGDFCIKKANRINRLYFPLFNLEGMMSSITPELKGDIKVGQNQFLTEPQVSENILQTKSSRNFWIKTSDGKVWSLPGVGALEQAKKVLDPEAENTDVLAGPGYFTIIRENPELNLKGEMTFFVPPEGGTFECAYVSIENKGKEELTLEATTAVPLYGRSADNLRDHRQVTTLLNRVEKGSHGLILKPTMCFDERGHREGDTWYSAFAYTEENTPLEGIVADLETFIGEGGSLEAPEMIFKDLPFEDSLALDGRQVIGAFRYPKVCIKPGEKTNFSFILGIHEFGEDVTSKVFPFNSNEKMEKALLDTKLYWRNQVDQLKIDTGDSLYDNWFVWVSLQPLMRKIFGCSFLPDFGYGRGGRGWRDLWQDCLGLLLTNPSEAKGMLLNNIEGVRIDGSNATIIGLKPGEFLADRNNIPRTWMDHGLWPFLTTAFYIEQTGDLSILLEKRAFFQDALVRRCKCLNRDWTPDLGMRLRDSQDNLFEAPVFLHFLIQNITQFFNRGDNGNIRLEDADWNDGMDMASEKGESVPFTAAYAGNIESLAHYLSELSQKHGLAEIEFPEEMYELLDFPLTEESCKPQSLRSQLSSYLDKTEKGISGKMISCSSEKIINLLEKMSELLCKNVRNNEFLECGEHQYFNGYYDNFGRRVEGLVEGKTQMTLTGQVFPIMSGVATIEQSKKAFQAAKNLLKDPVHGGFRLNTNLGVSRLDLGRAFSFSYGDKENGAFFSHMIIMFGNALYRRGLVFEGFEVLNSIFKMSSNTSKSMIFPCIPEYFNNEGRGLYCYITGSGSWMVKTVVTQMFGIRGNKGHLTFHPKLVKEQFNEKGHSRIQTIFQGKTLKVLYRNEGLLNYGDYSISQVFVNGKEVAFDLNEDGSASLIDSVSSWDESLLSCEVILSE